MSACPDRVRLVAASAGEDVVALAHAAACPGCRRTMREHLALRDLARELPAAPLRRAHRDGMAAELLARAESVVVEKPLPEEEVAPRRIRRAVAAVAIAAGALAAAAAAMVALDPPPPATSVPVVDVEPAPAVGPRTAVANVEAPPAHADRPEAASIRAAAGARYDRRDDGAVDRIALRDGTVTIESSATTAPVVVSGKNVKVRTGARAARLAATAEAGVVRQVQVFAGSVEIQTSSGVVVVMAGETWTWDEDAATSAARAAASDPEADARVAAFRAGWDALRAGDFATAATELERAEGDRGVGEDAAYWAAIAWGRAGQTARAIDGLERFLAKFPKATRAGEAHLALARLLDDPERARPHLEAAANDPDPRVRAAAQAALEAAP